MHLRNKIESSLKEILDDLEVIDGMPEILVIKAKIECLRLASETLSKLKHSTDIPTTEYVLPDFNPKN